MKYVCCFCGLILLLFGYSIVRHVLMDINKGLGKCIYTYRSLVSRRGRGRGMCLLLNIVLMLFHKFVVIKLQSVKVWREIGFKHVHTRRSET